MARGEVRKPRLASVCGTYLKPEMQSLYRQIANLQRFENVVLAEQLANLDAFPFDPVVPMTKLRRRKPRGNFLLRFWYKHVVKKWPPPRKITTDRPFYPYDLHLLLKSEAIDIAHVYYGHKAVKYRSMLEKWGGPWVVSFHGVDVVKFVKDEGYLDDLREVFACAKLVLARSRSLMDELGKLGCPAEKLRLNRTPIPFDAFPFASTRPTPPDGRWRLVQASRLIAKKGLFTTLEALPAVVERFPNAKFVLCGRGPQESEFRAAVEERGMGANVELAGWMDQPSLVDQYRRAHLFLHPSELTAESDQEGVPNAMLEAMASGLPVVATTHGGIPEAVTSGRDGILVPEKSPNELAAAILELLTDDSKRLEMGKNASDSVRKKFGFAEQISALEDCYEEALADEGAG